MVKLKDCPCIFLALVLTIAWLYAISETESLAIESDYPDLQDFLSQTADISVSFLGIPSEYIDQSILQNSLTGSVSQFAAPNTITWSLNISISFHVLPDNLTDRLNQNSHHYSSMNYYNVALFDQLYTEIYDQTIPNEGYQLVFTWIPDNDTSHSWFYVNERPDLFLGRTDSFNGYASQYWMFPPNFGGIHRTMYSDVSDLMRTNPTKTTVTNTVISLFNNAIPDIFPNLLGKTDPRMLEADTQKYEKYEVRIFWLNGTDDEQFPTDKIKNAFQDLMPWTNWTVTTQKMLMPAELSNLIENRTHQLSVPTNYSFTLANGSQYTIEAHRNLEWNVQQDSGENDPLSQYLFAHTKEYFNLTDLTDKSVIPVIILETRNDTGISGTAGIGPGISWFPHNTVILGIQGGTIKTMQESGPILLAHQIRHEIGHWTSLPHHSAVYGTSYPKVVCSMRSITDRFCMFCKDARARMSFISYYNATVQVLSANQAKKDFLRNEIKNAAAEFQNWAYTEAMESIVSVYDTAKMNILFPEITVTPSHIFSGETSNITVHITDGTNPVPETTVLLLSNTSETFSQETGTTDSNGDFHSTITIRATAEPTAILITANAAKNGFLTNHEEAQLFVNPSENSAAPFLLALTFALLGLSVCLTLFRRFRPSGK